LEAGIVAKAKVKPVEASPPQVETISSVHLLDCVSQPSLSNDKLHIMVVFKVGDPADESTHRKFALVFPTVQAKWLLSVVYGCATMAEKAGAPVGEAVLNLPTMWGLGHHPMLDAQEFKLADGQVMAADRGKTVISFDRGGPSEMNYVMLNVAAAGMGAALLNEVSPRLTEAEKQEIRDANTKRPQ
jgi:hypothetical protein